mmetsp:Transcript_36130/g.59328  ORF Transcript_36130/g.59328 Transcript_36130/m.59328 type:complete len:223 (-) Transcript_36130:1340-2008(-)
MTRISSRPRLSSNQRIIRAISRLRVTRCRYNWITSTMIPSLFITHHPMWYPSMMMMRMMMRMIRVTIMVLRPSNQNRNRRHNAPLRSINNVVNRRYCSNNKNSLCSKHTRMRCKMATPTAIAMAMVQYMHMHRMVVVVVASTDRNHKSDNRSNKAHFYRWAIRIWIHTCCFGTIARLARAWSKSCKTFCSCRSRVILMRPILDLVSLPSWPMSTTRMNCDGS